MKSQAQSNTSTNNNDNNINSIMTEQDGNILKSALAFVVVRRRLNAKKEGLSISSSLPFTLQLSATSENGRTRSNCVCDNDDDLEKENMIDQDSNNDNHNNDVNEQVILPFLDGINFMSKTKNNKQSTTSHDVATVITSDNNDCSQQRQCPSKISLSTATVEEKNHLIGMLRVARSTAVSLYSKYVYQTLSIDTPKKTSNHKSNHLPHMNTKKSLVYDFQTASLSKIYCRNKVAQSSYNVLDGILLHVTSTLRTMKAQSKRLNTNHEDDNGNDSILYSFMIQNLLGLIVSIDDNHPTINNTPSSNRVGKFYNQNFTKEQTRAFIPSSSTSSTVTVIQSILAICTILHRIVLFDVSLSSEVIEGLCGILRCLYYNHCYCEKRIMKVLLAGYHKNKNESINFDNSDRNGSDRQDSRNRHGSFMKRKYSTTPTNKVGKNDMDTTSKVDEEKNFHKVQIEDVLAVNCLILLEQVIGMSLTLPNATATSSARTAIGSFVPNSRVMQNEIVENILSILHLRLGPDLMIPVPTNDMANMYIVHERRKNNSYRKGDGTGKDTQVKMLRGLNVGAKMMVRLYIYDIVQKLSYHGNST